MKIFISYRRADSSTITDRITERLGRVYCRGQIFHDTHSIHAGTDFEAAILDAINESAVMLVIIGPNWANTKDEKGRPRLDNPQDWVRLEVETGLRLSKVHVILVLVNGATMPREAEMPPGSRLQDLSRIEAVRVRDGRDFERDMQDLLDILREKVKPCRRWWPLIGLLLLIVLLGIGAMLYNNDGPGPDPTEAPTSEGSEAVGEAIGETATSTITDTASPEAATAPATERPSDSPTLSSSPPSPSTHNSSEGEAALLLAPAPNGNLLLRIEVSEGQSSVDLSGIAIAGEPLCGYRWESNGQRQILPCGSIPADSCFLFTASDASTIPIPTGCTGMTYFSQLEAPFWQGEYNVQAGAAGSICPAEHCRISLIVQE